MNTFRVTKEQQGWSVMLGPAVTAPCKSQAAAIAQAKRMADAIRRHGVAVEIIMEPSAVDADTSEKPTRRKTDADAALSAA